MAHGHLGEEAPEVGGHGQVPAFIELLAPEAGPAPVDAAALDRPAQGQHGGAVAVIGAPVSVLSNRPAELRHREDHDVAHPGSEISVNRGKPFGEFLETQGELPPLVALPRVGVPAAHVREGDRKSTRLNSSHMSISYAVFCLKKK